MKQKNFLKILIVLAIFLSLTVITARAGTITYFTSMGTKATQRLVAAFDKQNTGIKVNWLRLTAVKLTNRIITERMAGKKNIDVVNSSDAFNLEYMIGKGWITKYAGQLEGAKKIPSQFKHPLGYWVSMRLNNLAIVVNTDKIRPEDEPKSWMDLKNPKYRNKIGFGDPGRSATALIMYYYIYKNFGIEQLQAIMDNGALIMGGLSSVRQALFTGERPVGVTSTYGILAAIKKKNLPLKVIIPTEGMPVLPSPVFIPEGAPNLADGKRFIEFMLSKTGQDIIINDVLTYSAVKGLPPPKGMPEISQSKPWIYDWNELYRTKDDFERQLDPLLAGRKKKKKKK